MLFRGLFVRGITKNKCRLSRGTYLSPLGLYKNLDVLFLPGYLVYEDMPELFLYVSQSVDSNFKLSVFLSSS